MSIKKTPVRAESGHKAVSRRRNAPQAQPEAPVAEQPEASPRKFDRKQAALKAEADRQKILKEFNPEVLGWIKDNLGLDLADKRIPVRFIYDLHQNKFTEPVEITFTPLAYDKEAKRSVGMPRMSQICSIQMKFPYEDGKMVVPDDKHTLYFANVPCRPLIDKPVSGERQAAVPEAAVADEKAPMPVFTDAQKMALEGVGVNSERLYGGFNGLDREMKQAILDGEMFEVDGSVKTSFGTVNVNGVARMDTDEDGSVRTTFQSTYPEKRSENKVIDLMSARRIGILELDFYERDFAGRIKHDEQNRPLPNRAARNLLAYGDAMEPVKGIIHNRTYDKKDKKWVDKSDTRYYQVSVVNTAVTGRDPDDPSKTVSLYVNNLYAKEMKKVPDLNPDGTKVTYKDAEGNLVERTHYEVANCRIADGKVFVDGKSGALEFKSDKERDSYIRGFGGVVIGATYHDYRSNKDVTYDAFAVSKATRAGFAEVFTPATTNKILKERDQVVHRSNKTGFGIGR